MFIKIRKQFNQVYTDLKRPRSKAELTADFKRLFRTIVSCLMFYLVVQGITLLVISFGLNHIHRTYKDWTPVTAHVISITPPATTPIDGSDGYYSSVIRYVAEGSTHTVTQSVEGAPRYKQGQNIKIKYSPGYANNFYVDDGYDSAEIIYFLFLGSCLIIFPALILLYMHTSGVWLRRLLKGSDQGRQI